MLQVPVKMINLAVVALSPVIEKHSLDQVLQPFISDVNTLASSGITFEMEGTSKTVKGALRAFLADNLASNKLGCLKKSFSFAFRWCSTCLVTTNSICSSFVSHDFKLRTSDTHLQHLQNINGPASSYYSKTYGINKKSALLQTQDFSLFNDGLPDDATHDILGVAFLEIKKSTSSAY